MIGSVRLPFSYPNNLQPIPDGFIYFLLLAVVPIVVKIKSNKLASETDRPGLILELVVKPTLEFILTNEGQVLIALNEEHKVLVCLHFQNISQLLGSSLFLTTIKRTLHPIWQKDWCLLWELNDR